MSLPPLSIPHIPLPFGIPEMLHPAVVHFAVALPVLVILIELINLFVKKRVLGVMSFFFMLLIAVVFLGAYLTGVTDGKAAKAFLSPEAKALLVSHKQLGIYLVYSSGILLLFKLFSVMIRKTAIKVLFFLVLILFTAAVLNEGGKGGMLVFEHGVNVRSVPAIGKKAIPETVEQKEVKSKIAETAVSKAAETEQASSTVTPTAETNGSLSETVPKEEAAVPEMLEPAKSEGNVTE